MARRALVIALAGIAFGCGGKVFIDLPSGGGGGTAGAGGSSSSGGTCEPTQSGFGKPTDVCLPMDGDFCPPGATSPSVLHQIADQLGICADVPIGSCCGQPFVDAVLCDEPPGTTTCCYLASVGDFGACAD